MVNKKLFYDKYDNGSFHFDNVQFRVGAGFTLGFDIYTKQDFDKNELFFDDGREFYFHPAVDRAHGDIVCPFDCRVEFKKDVPGYGSMLVMYPLFADFMVRIAHITHVSINVREAIDNNTILPAGVYVAKTGTAGVGTGPHSHTEIVSIGERSEICDEILVKRGYKTDFSIIADKLEDLPYEARNKAHDYISARGMTHFSANKCVRYDGYISKPHRVTYYNSRAVFGM